MKNVSGDFLGLVAELASRRIPMVMGKRAKRRGGRLGLTKQQEQLLITVRALHKRFMRGQYEAAENEIDKTLGAAQLLVAIHVEDTGGDDAATSKRLVFDRRKLLAAESMAVGTYQKLIYAIHDGQLDAVSE